LNFTVVTYAYFIPNKYILSQGNIPPNLRTATNMHPMPNARTSPYLRASINYRSVVNCVISQGAISLKMEW